MAINMKRQELAEQKLGCKKNQNLVHDHIKFEEKIHDPYGKNELTKKPSHKLKSAQDSRSRRPPIPQEKTRNLLNLVQVQTN